MTMLKKQLELNSKSKEKKAKRRQELNSKKIEDLNESALSYDRDKNSFYRPNDESLLEVYDDDGYQTMEHVSWHQSSRYH